MPRIFERRWALTLLEQARERLREEYVRIGKAEQYERLKVFEAADGDAPSYAEVGAQLDMTLGAVKSAVHRLRARYHELVRDEIAHTVASPAEIDEEIQYLIGVIGK